ncbi:MAG: xanthine dehydrogenase family protein molybdopterin-binding subunit [Syntrophorhabdaceae bacterium]|nr:xanthine dehydrogenase family protein molybdopterin-binding subunit [Syntrophorhabdaceae bacterium]
MEKKEKYIKIGESVPRFDAYTKVTGEEKYAVDLYGKGFLWAGVKRAGIPHGILKEIHIEKAVQSPGVFTVLTYKDIPGVNRIGIVRKDQPVLVDRKICYVGDPVALVLAEDKDTLMEAIKSITFDYEPLEGIFSIEEALSEDAPIIHEEFEGGNIIKKVSVETGSGESALDGCDVMIEGTFDVPFQEHAYLETEAGWAYKEDDGKIVIVATTQTPFRDILEIAPVLGMDLGKIRVVAPYLGGAFGGKDGITVQCLLGLALLYSEGRPVKMWWNREESFTASVKRLSAKMHYKIGADSNGVLKALVCDLYYNGGAYASLGGEIMTLGVEHAGSAYRIPNVSIKGSCIYTNNPVGGPFRGFGVPQVTYAMEQMMDMLAEKLRMDPIELRLKNVVHRGDKNGIGITLTQSVGISECIEKIKGHPLWKNKDRWKKRAGPYKIRGVGVACMAHAMGYPAMVPDQATAKIEITDKGKIRVYAGVVDMGQGNISTYVQIAAHILRQDVSTMELVLPDTNRTLPCGSSSASRTTYTYGNALIGATKKLKDALLKKVSLSIKGSTADDFILEPQYVKHLPSGKKIPLYEIARLFHHSERIFFDYFRMPIASCGLDAIYMGPHLIYSYGAHLVYIEIDTLTGRIDVKRYLAVTDAGKVMNPQLYEQQIHGAITQGIGYALTESFKVVKGKVLTENLTTYTIPTSMDIPQFISITVEKEEETGPFGLKGVGEIAVSGPLPAIANGIADACKKRIFSAPMTSEKLLMLLETDKRT